MIVRFWGSDAEKAAWIQRINKECLARGVRPLNGYRDVHDVEIYFSKESLPAVLNATQQWARLGDLPLHQGRFLKHRVLAWLYRQWRLLPLRLLGFKDPPASKPTLNYPSYRVIVLGVKSDRTSEAGFEQV